jgi:hypothetical protein
MAVFNLTSHGSDLVAAWLYEHHVSFDSLIIINAASTLATLGIIPALSPERP